MIPVEAIFKRLIEQAKQGSCKTCRWCPLVDDMGARACLVSTNSQMPVMDAQALGMRAYPYICSAGRVDAEYGRLCIAFQPSLTVIPNFDNGAWDAAVIHRCFLNELSRAMQLYNDIRNNTLAKLTATLNEVTESIPGGRQ